MLKVIILAGGSGTRLWPLSRDRYPKQFIKFKEGSSSLFQETFIRSLLVTDIDDIIVVTNEKYKFLVSGEIAELGYEIKSENIIVEPEPKNTLPAIFAGVKYCNYSGDCTFLVMPSDHMITYNDKFAENIKQSFELSKERIISFGIIPDTPNTGYGYIAPASKLKNGFLIKEFKEKPDYETAVKYIKSGYFWNSGIFMFGKDLFLDDCRLYAPDITDAFDKSEDIKSAFKQINRKISIDYGIMEKTQRAAVVPVDIGWSDLGSFESIHSVLDKDLNNNICNSDSVIIDSNNNYIYTEKNKLISLIGINNSIIVDNRDALMICDKSRSQDVKEVVEKLKSRNDSRTDYHIQDYRPWGHYKILEEEQNSFKIKRIKVEEGKSLSYQLHYHRSEHWVVVKGMALVTIDAEEKFVSAGESIFIKQGQKHRLTNPGKTPLEIIEVQIGDYLEEDDIIRFDDEYGRK